MKHSRGDRGLRITAALAALLIAGAVYVWVAFVADDDLDTKGPSMRPTLSGPERIGVDVAAYSEEKPEVGEIVVVQAPAHLRRGECRTAPAPGSPCGVPFGSYSLQRLVKRVVAGPGDTVAFRADGTLVRNGRSANEPYIRTCPGTCGLPNAITVPERHYFLAGDNRLRSSDSRIWGPVPLAAFDGRVDDPEGS